MKNSSHVSKLQIEFDREDDGRWIAEIPSLPGVMAYGTTQEEACRKVEAVALHTLADRREQGEETPQVDDIFAGV